MNKNNITFIEIINMMIRRWWLILTLSIIGAIIAYMYTDFFTIPMYKTDGSLYVNCETDSVELDESASAGKLNSNSRLAETYVEILKRRSFLTGVAADVGNKYTYDQIQGMVSIEPVNETELLEITVRGTNPKDIQDILTSMLSRASQELTRVVKAGSVEIVDLPYEPASPYSPNITTNTLIGVIIGFILSIGIIIWLEIFDTKIKTADQIKNVYDEPLLGEIPSLEEE